MPACVLCKRTVPPAPGMPNGIGVVCAHVDGKGEPCPEKPADTYDDEIYKLFEAEDGFWAPELRRNVHGGVAQTDASTPAEAPAGGEHHPEHRVRNPEDAGSNGPSPHLHLAEGGAGTAEGEQPGAAPPEAPIQAREPGKGDRRGPPRRRNDKRKSLLEKT